MEPVKGLYTDVTPKYINTMYNLNPYGLKLLLLAQFILVNKTEDHTRIIKFSYPLVQSLGSICGLDISKIGYTRGLKELIDKEVLVKVDNKDLYSVCPAFDYISMEEIIEDAE